MISKLCATVGHHLVKATEVTAGLAESNGSLPPGVQRDQLRAQRSVMSTGKLHIFTVPFLLSVQQRQLAM